MATSTERWSERQQGRDGSARTATRAWDVIDAANEDAAFAATAETGTLPIQSVGQTHPLSTLLRCKSRTAKSNGGPRSWIVTCEYTSESVKAENSGGSPLDQSPVVYTRNVTLIEQTETDWHGNAIANAVGQVFDQPSTREVFVLEVYCRINEPFYDVVNARLLDNAVNTDTISVLGITALPGQALSRSPVLVGEYTVPNTQGFVVSEYMVAIRFDSQIGWDDVRANIGLEGKYSGNILARFVDTNGGLINTPVRLKADGTPIDTSIKVGKWVNGSGYQAQTPIAVTNTLTTDLAAYTTGGTAPYIHGSSSFYKIAFQNRQRQALGPLLPF
jgi:hypothetical protein